MRIVETIETRAPCRRDAVPEVVDMPKSSQLTITLTPELEAFIQERVASGRFSTASEAVREGLHLLKEREQDREVVLTELRHEIEIGVEQAKAGQLIDGRTFFEELRRTFDQHRERLRPHAGRER